MLFSSILSDIRQNSNLEKRIDMHYSWKFIDTNMAEFVNDDYHLSIISAVKVMNIFTHFIYLSSTVQLDLSFPVKSSTAQKYSGRFYIVFTK